MILRATACILEMIGARELWIGAVDRYRPRGRVDSQRERALTEKLRKNNDSQRESKTFPIFFLIFLVKALSL